MTNKEEQQIWLDKLKREYPEAGNTPSALNGIPREPIRTVRDIMLAFETRINLECENFMAQARLRLHDDARALVAFDSMAEMIRNTYTVAAIEGVKVWNDIAPK